MSIVEVQNLNFGIDDLVILKNITFSIQKGDYLAIVGPNGGGKSTLIHTILGLKRGYSGNIKLFNTPLQKFREWHRIGFVPQRVIEVDKKFPISVYETIQLGERKRFWKREKKNGYIDEVMERLKIAHLKNRLIGELSGGEKQRVMIARALISQPELLILDEPYTGIDKETQKEFYAILHNLNRKKRITIVLITHDIGVVEDSITSIVSVNKELLKSDNPSNIFNCQVMREVYGIDSHLIEHRH